MRRRLAAIGAGAAVLVAAVAVVVVVTQSGGGPAPKPTATPTRTPRPTPTPTPSPPPLPAAGKGLAVGITEANPNLIASPANRTLQPPWSRWRADVGAIRPAFYRLLIDWAAIQPSAGVPADLAQYQGGCARDVPPCLPYSGLTEQLQALASRQREGGWQALAVLATTPDWAAAAPSGCERPGTRARNRPPRVQIQKLLVTGDNRLKQGVDTQKVRETFERALEIARAAGLEEQVRPLVELRLADLERLRGDSAE